MVVNIGTAGRATDAVTQRVVMMKENEKPTRLEQVRAGACAVLGVLVLHACTRACAWVSGAVVGGCGVGAAWGLMRQV